MKHYITRAQGPVIVIAKKFKLGVVLQAFSGASQVCELDDMHMQGIPAFCNFINCYPRYFANILKALDLFSFSQYFNL